MPTGTAARLTRSRVETVLAIAVLALSLVPIGGAVFVLGFGFGDSPCVMCWEQRIGMILVALLGLFILRYGPRPKYIGLAIAVAAWGVFMALRHTGMHAARDIGQGFSLEVLGAHTYTWALAIYWVCIATMALLLIALDEFAPAEERRPLRPLHLATFWIFLIVVAANAVQAFASTGPPPFVGQSDPVRFSFSPRHWVWSLDEWSARPASLRGRWAADKPDLTRVDANPAAGPLVGAPRLAGGEHRTLALPLNGAPTSLAYDASSDRFLLTTASGVYLLDGSLGRVLRYTVIDRGFSVDLDRLAGAAFLDSHSVIAVSENKSYVLLRETDHQAASTFRFFLESFDRFEELARSRFTTVRARMMYIHSLAFDGRSLYTITVPNSMTRRMVVSRFDRSDMTLSEEFSPVIGPGASMGLRTPRRSLDDLYVTAATFDDGRLYALSAAYDTVLSIDPVHRVVVGAATIAGIQRPTGIAVKDGRLYIVCDDATLYIVSMDALTSRRSAV